MVKGKLKMSYQRKILFAGTTSSGSSALFDYFRCFDNTCGLVSELPFVFRKTLYPKWASQNFQYSSGYKKRLNNDIDKIVSKKFGTKLDGSVLLLNNVITCLILRGIELLDNTQIFCVVRDPRSTWLRRKELCKKHGKKITVVQFIGEYKHQRELFKNNLNKLKQYKDQIYLIQFEDFLLDVSCRDKAIKWAGFDIKDYPVNPEFAPYPKEKSILLHQFYKKQDEISLIKKELGEYCNEKV